MSPAVDQAAFRDVGFTTPMPFDETDGEPMLTAYRENVASVYEAGGRLFVPCGNTGEYYALTDDERVAMVEATVDAVGGDATVVGGVAGSGREAAALARRYADVGADAVMVMHPDHTYQDEPGLIQYYEEVADATDLGVVLYKRGPVVTRDVIASLSEREDVVAVKFALNDIKEFSQSVADVPGEVTWMNGIAERYALSFAIEGAEGLTTGIGNFVPEASLALFEALQAEDWERARELRDLLRPLEDIREESAAPVFHASNNVPTVKHGLELAGRTGGTVRPPLTPLSSDDEERVARAYERVVEAVGHTES